VKVQVLKAQTNVLRDKAATLKIALQHARKEGDGLRAAIVEVWSCMIYHQLVYVGAV
jgi:hypothetical protein